MPTTVLEAVRAKEKELSIKRGEPVRLFVCTQLVDTDRKLETYTFLSYEDDACLFMRDQDDNYTLETVPNGKSFFPYGSMQRPFYLMEDWLLSKTNSNLCTLPTGYCSNLWFRK